jgi:hypothetical protein
LSTEKELIQNKEMSLKALQELLSDTKTQRPEMSYEISKIEKAIKDIEEVKNHVKKFNDLEQVVNNFIASAVDEPPNPLNLARSARFNKIREAIKDYKNAYANYAAYSINRKGN